jgi:TPR repeat protein
LEWNDKNGNAKKAFEYLQQAHEQDPTNALVNCYLSAHCFYRKDFANVIPFIMAP